MQDISAQMREAGDLIKAADACKTTEEIIALAKSHGISVTVQSISSDSLPPEEKPELEPEEELNILKEQVKGTVRDKARSIYIARQRYLKLHPELKNARSTEQLIKEIKACPTIDKLFALVKEENIIIPMKSFSSASGLPKQKPELKPKGSPLDRLKEQVLSAVKVKEKEKPLFEPEPPKPESSKPAKPAPQPEHSKAQLVRAIETVPTIEKLFELVKKEHIVIQMKSFSSASGLPQYKPELIPDKSPLERLKEQVLNAVRGHTKEQLIRAVDTCPSIDKLFELIKNEHINIRMKSFSSASCLPRQTFGEDELRPDKLPLDRLKEQVRDAIMNS